jgi:hypothetical protein
MYCFATFLLLGKGINPLATQTRQAGFPFLSVTLEPLVLTKAKSKKQKAKSGLAGSGFEIISPLT